MRRNERKQAFNCITTILSNNPNRLQKFEQFYDKYSTFSNFEQVLEDEYASEYAQYRDSIVIDLQSDISKSLSCDEKHFKEISVLMNKIEKNTRTTSVWVKFLGIITLILIIYTLISLIVTGGSPY